jgi:hypothetical protein
MNKTVQHVAVFLWIIVAVLLAVQFRSVYFTKANKLPTLNSPIPIRPRPMVLIDDHLYDAAGRLATVDMILFHAGTFDPPIAVHVLKGDLSLWVPPGMYWVRYYIRGWHGF